MIRPTWFADRFLRHSCDVLTPGKVTGVATVKLHGRSRISQAAGILLWLVINAGLWFCLVWVLLKKTRVVWWIGAASYAAAVLLHGLISSRCGCVTAWQTHCLTDLE